MFNAQGLCYNHVQLQPLEDGRRVIEKMEWLVAVVHCCLCTFPNAPLLHL